MTHVSEKQSRGEKGSGAPSTEVAVETITVARREKEEERGEVTSSTPSKRGSYSRSITERGRESKVKRKERKEKKENDRGGRWGEREGKRENSNETGTASGLSRVLRLLERSE